MADRIARLIERLLDQADVAAESADWPTVADACRRVLAADPSNTDALALLQMAGTETSDAGLTVAGPLGERRIVTVLFADAVGFTPMSETLDEEEVYELIQRCVAVMTAAVERHSGYVAQFRGDGIMALFGAPVAQERAEVAAVTAALEMQDGLSGVANELAETLGVHLSFRVGLNTGGVVVGSISGDIAADFTALGDTVNLAARMEQIATPGSVFLTARTEAAVAGFVECRDLGTVTVKGKSDDVHAFEAVRALSATDRIAAASVRGLSKFVGRQVELGLLEGLFRRTLRGRGQAVVITGEAGIGKSRLAHELQQSLPGTRWLTGRCSPERQAAAFFPLAEIVRSVTEDDSVILGDDSHEAFLRVLLGDQPDETIAAVDPRDRNARVLDLVVAALEVAAAGGSLVAVIEDAHWADGATWSALGALVERVANLPVLVVVTSRPGYDAPLDATTDMTQLRLEPLDEDEVAELIEAQGDEALGRLSPAIWQRSEGNPFFAEELLRSLEEVGGTYGDVPDSVNEIILARIDRLPPEARHLLQLAAVIGREVDRSLLECLAGRELDELLGVLDTADLLRPSNTEPVRRLVFRHALTQEVTYSTLLHATRRDLHGAVAAQLEKVAGDGRAGIESVLASHYERAEQWPEAATHLQLAANRAASTGAVQSALDLFERCAQAAERVGDQGKVIEVAQQRASIGMVTGHLDVAKVEWERLRRIANANDDRRLQVVAQAQLGILAQFSHDEDAADTATAAAVEMAREVVDADASAAALGARFWFSLVSGRLDQIDGLRRRYLVDARDASDSARTTWRINEPMISRWTGDFQEAIRLTESGVDSITTGGHTVALAKQAWIRTMALTEASRFEEALELGVRVSDDCERLGETMWRARLLNTIGWLFHEVLDDSQAAQWNERSLAIALDTPVPDTEIRCNAHLNLVENLIRLGDLDEAAIHLRNVSDVVEHPARQDWFMHWRYSQRFHAVAGDLALANGDNAQATQHAAACRRQALDTGSRKYLARADRLHAGALLGAGDLGAAWHRINSSVNEALALGGPGQLWRSYLLAADVAAAAHETESEDDLRAKAEGILTATASTLSEPRRSCLLNSPVYLAIARPRG